jgi:hypothetical protein
LAVAHFFRIRILIGWALFLERTSGLSAALQVACCSCLCAKQFRMAASVVQQASTIINSLRRSPYSDTNYWPYLSKNSLRKIHLQLHINMQIIYTENICMCWRIFKNILEILQKVTTKNFWPSSLPHLNEYLLN